MIADHAQHQAAPLCAPDGRSWAFHLAVWLKLQQACGQMLDEAWPHRPGAKRYGARAAWLREPNKAPQILVRTTALHGWLVSIVGPEAGPIALRSILRQLEAVGLLRPVPWHAGELPAVVAMPAAILEVHQ